MSRGAGDRRTSAVLRMLGVRVDLYTKYGLRRVVNAYDKATSLCGARVGSSVASVISECLGSCFILDELQEAAGRAIAERTGAEWGCVTACAASAITLGVAAAMTGKSQAGVAQLPDTRGLPHKVVIQKGHCINFGVPVTQMIRLSGANVVEAGTETGCTAQHMELALREEDVAAVYAVESYHTHRYPGLALPALAEVAHNAGVPLLVDAATQELRLRELVAMGPALVSCSAHKYLESTTAGVVAGRRELVEALLMHHAGIGRGMKVGKEGIFGVLAAFDASPWQDTGAWTAEQNRKIGRVMEGLQDIRGVETATDPDPNGCPFLRVRLVPDPDVVGHTALSLREALAEGDPSVKVRRYGYDPTALYINTTEMEDEEIGVLCAALRSALKTS